MAIDTRRAAERAHILFKDQQWKWGGWPFASMDVPSVENIERVIHDGLAAVAAKKLKPGEQAMYETGRLRIQRDCWKDTDETSVLLVLGNEFDTIDPEVS